MADLRIPFEEAVGEARLLKHHFDTLSRPQQVAVKSFYGLPLSGEELNDWAVFQDNATADPLGFTQSVRPTEYRPKEYDTLVAILGRRSGKSLLITSTILAYEAALGGHQSHVLKNQDFQIFFVGQDLAMAGSHLKGVAAALSSSPLLSKYVVKDITAGIFLKNGLTIVPQPPTIKSPRGMAIPVVVMDEVGFWYTDAKSANPDFEVYRAIRYAQMQFPNAKRIVTSTPWTKEGLLWQYNVVGTEGVKIRCQDCHTNHVWHCKHRLEEQLQHEGVLVIHAPTAAMGNPEVTRKVLAKLQREDPDAFVRESMAEFVDSISGAMPAAFVASAMDLGVTSREVYPRKDHPEDPRPFYVAAMDPAFRNDSFAFTIVHHDPKLGMVQDRLAVWIPQKGIPLNPAVVLDQIHSVLNEFGLNVIYSDQLALEAIQQLCSDRGFTMVPEVFTSQKKVKIFGSLEMLVKQRRLRLLDDATQYTQLVQLEKRKTANGTLQYGAPSNKHDDIATVLALAVYEATWMLTPATNAEPPKQSHVARGMAQIRAQERERFDEDD